MANEFGSATPQYINDTDSGSLLNRYEDVAFTFAEFKLSNNPTRFSQDVSLITQRLAIFVNQFVFCERRESCQKAKDRR